MKGYASGVALRSRAAVAEEPTFAMDALKKARDDHPESRVARLMRVTQTPHPSGCFVSSAAPDESSHVVHVASKIGGLPVTSALRSTGSNRPAVSRSLRRSSRLPLSTLSIGQ
ncbi:hypothetical protein GCM10009574_005890 [Streptomyces asiaticus]